MVSALLTDTFLDTGIPSFSQMTSGRGEAYRTNEILSIFIRRGNLVHYICTLVDISRFIYLKVDVDSSGISGSHHHETLDFCICESWPHWVNNRMDVRSLAGVVFDIDKCFLNDKH